uniref:Uncharacterized protein n=1 Tax=Anguilla anguilla TaxID=7936 RepID=A0A0E9XFJ6_ANGAN
MDDLTIAEALEQIEYTNGFFFL